MIKWLCRNHHRDWFFWRFQFHIFPFDSKSIEGTYYAGEAFFIKRKPVKFLFGKKAVFNT